MNDFAQRLADLSPEQRAHLQEKLQQITPRKQRSTIPRRSTTEPAPLSFTQQRLWFLAQLDPHSPVYNTSDAVRIQGDLKLETLQQALIAIAERHEILRTTIEQYNGHPVQKVGNYPIDFSQVDSRSEADCQRCIEQFARQPFDLTERPLWRILLLQLDHSESVLVLTRHHLISDGWSAGIFWQELGALYEAFLTQQPSPLPELPIQYADFALWQQQRFEAGDLRSHLAYWEQQLSGTVPVLELPSDHSRPAMQSFSGAQYRFRIAHEQTAMLKRVAQQEQATLFMVLLAAFNTLLYRYTQQEDIWIGTPIANRTSIETERLIGFFANTVVMRSNLSGNPTFRELLKRVRDRALEAYTYQSFPFEKLVQVLQPERSLAHNPLFQVMFTLQNLPERVQTLSGLELQPIQLNTGSAKFDLALEISEVDGALHACFEYNTDLFEAATIERMSGHLLTLVAGIVEDSSCTLSALPLLSDAEQAQLIAWNATETDYPDCCIHQLFEAQVERTPDAIAVTFAARSLTYRELNQRANQVAHALQELGVVPGQLVGLCVERSIEMVVGMLGILKAGGAYVPLDPDYPRSRLALMREDANLSILVTQSWLVESLSLHQAKLVCLDQWESIEHHCQSNPIVHLQPTDLAYVLYTSGSTGTPKGVIIAHRSLVNAVWAFQREFLLNSADTWTAVASLSFDISALEICVPLISGAQVVIVSREVALDGKRLAELMRSVKATIADFTPVTWQILLEAGWQGQPNLRMLSGGEALSKELAKRLLAFGSLWNLYGPTETTIYSTLCRVTSATRSPAIGTAIANTQLYILDRNFQPVPIGVPGELYIGGDGLAIGYLNRPDLTDDRFIPMPPTVTGRATRLYKTGDLVRYLPDGNVEYLGRIDHQVKIRGFRIELGEIESVLMQHDAVQRAVATVREDQPGEKILVAYVVLSQPVSITELRNCLKTRLPDYMIPNAIVILEQLPLTPSGKIDRRSLPAPTHPPESQDKAASPQTPVETQLAAIWEEMLGRKGISKNDNFFELGGHSLIATRIIARIEAEFQINLPLRRLFEAPTIAELALLIVQQQIESLNDEELLEMLNLLED